MNCEELIRFCKKHKRIYCYGAGKYGRTVCVFLKENGIEIEGFLVTENGQESEEVLAKKVLPLDRWSADQDAGIVLAVGERHQQAMREELRRRGVDDFFPVDDALLEELEEKTAFSESYPTNQYVNVLLYHQIDRPGRNPWNTIVSPNHFEEHVRFLADTYPVLRFEDDWSKAAESSVVLTFDDGYVDNLEITLPILRKYNVPATFFISTGYIDTGESFWWDALDQVFHDSPEDMLVIGEESIPKGNVKKAHSVLRQMAPTQRDQVLSGLKSSVDSKHRLPMRPMSVDELKKFSNSPLVTIGAHTVSHSSLQFESSELQAWEIGESRKMLESWLDRRIDLFSYPFGDCSVETVQLLKEKGFVKAGTVAAGLSGTGDPFQIPRNVVRDWPIEAFTKFMRRTWCLFAEMKN